MPAPREGEKQKDFISRCISYIIKKEGKKRDQAVAICHSLWEEKKSKSDAYKKAKGV